MAGLDDDGCRRRSLELFGRLRANSRLLCPFWLLFSFAFSSTGFGRFDLYSGFYCTGEEPKKRSKNHFLKYPYFQVTAFVVIPMTINRGILCGSLLLGGFIFFLCISKLGEKLLSMNEAKERTNTVACKA